MRPSVIAALALVSAAVGAAGVLLVGAAAGWVGPSRTETVVAPAPDAENETAGLTQAPEIKSEGRPLAGNGFDPAALYSARVPGVVTVYALFGSQAQGSRGGQGSGFVVSRHGIVLTSAHVVTEEGATGRLTASREVYVEFTDLARVRARIVGWDAFADVAALRVDPQAHRLTPVPLGDSSRVAVGEPVAAIGSPFGEQASLSVGVVSATGRSINSLTSRYHLAGAIQTDAPINKGNSGGPLFDARGRVIGINAQIRTTSGTAEGVAFAVPINAAKRSLRALLRGGTVSYAYLGVTAEDVPPDLARRLHLPVSGGALIVQVNPGPARTAGLHGSSRTISLGGRRFEVGGDVVIAVGRHRIRGSDDLVKVVTERLRPGQLVTLTVIRSGSRLRIPIRLGARAANESD
jgi:S1-C subfamily serine protease